MRRASGCRRASTVHLSYGDEEPDGVRPAARRRPPRARLGPGGGDRSGPDARPRPGRARSRPGSPSARSSTAAAGAVGAAGGHAPATPQTELLAAAGRDAGVDTAAAAERLLGRVRVRRRRRDHGADDRRLRLRGDRPGPRRRTARRGRPTCATVWVELFGGTPGRRVHRGGVVRRRRPRRAALAVRLDATTTARRGTCAGSTC